MNGDLARSNSLADLAARISVEHEAATGAVKRGLQHAISAGDLLLEAKAQLKHGQWLPWLESCGLSERTAQRYIRLARNREAIEAKSDNVSDLSVSAALALVSAPRDFKDDVAEASISLADDSADAAAAWVELQNVLTDSANRRALWTEAQAAADKIGRLFEQCDEERRPALGRFIEDCAECEQITAKCREMNRNGSDSEPSRVGDVRNIRDLAVAWLSEVETAALNHRAAS
jgi:hypothetical protein